MDISAAHIEVGAGVFVGSLALTTAAIVYALVRIPPDRFARSDARFLETKPPLVRALARAGMNLLGLALIGLGVVLSLPGVPGQGILTILLGVMLTDIPGKEHLERKIVCRPRVYKAINKLRARFGKPPLVLPGSACSARR